MQSTNNTLSLDQPYLDRLAEVNFNPIFIMGDHRSGTTLLYKTLAATECFNFVKAYHIIKYDEILSNYIYKKENQAIQELEELFKSLGISDRKIDQVVATPNLPEEYGFILKNVAGDESSITPKNLPIFQQLCRKIQLTSDPDKPLLLKNPWDMPQFMDVKSIFPAAKFIFIHRYPIHIINSKLKAVRLMLSIRGAYTALISRRYRKIYDQPIRRLIYQFLYSSYFNLGLKQVTKTTSQSTSYYLNNISSLPSIDYLSITYEEFCKNPKAIISKILGFLQLQPKSTLDYENLIKPRPVKLLPEVKSQSDEICHKLQAYLTYHGYDT
ncbi:stf0 sulfotransferase family protein [Lyngbya aestuarii BL J]|uniref:Stf0 sulfotransferase family protein n=1 Tax=Lyngbya aestuarii BL J TaxID=1348334 RepID=U7QMR9_9CYAN|nr:sulfotransferase [Lyngbya aestuarii]ERT07706.1 stf0 sulfotransferase family protein [Lyngbya aestuarii BL J]